MFPILRNVHLTVAGNMAAARQPYTAFWPDDPVFVFTQSCTFVDADDSPRAADPNAWLERFAAASHGLWLSWAPGDGPLPVWMTQSERWTITAVGDDGSDFWQDTETLGDQNAPDDKIWRTVYRRVGRDRRDPLPPPEPLTTAGQALKDALDDILAFDKSLGGNGSDVFGKSFRDARALLDAPPGSSFDRMYFPPELAWAPARLFASARAAWVFGGMGAWNDQVFDGETKANFERATGALYGAICDAAATAANATFPVRRALTPN
jgi:hypothetical protein